MKILSLLVLVMGVASVGQAAETWQDTNGVVWTMVAGRTTHYRAQARCQVLGFKLPSTDDLLEAFDAGLADPDVNTAFGAQARSIDWAWTSTAFPAPSPVYDIVSRWGDSTPVPADERHFVLCAK